MSQEPKGVRLYLRKRKGRKPVWIIKDWPKQISTGCGVERLAEAEERLAEYLRSRWKPDTAQRDIGRIQIAEVLALYGTDLPAHSPSRQLVGYHIANLMRFWGDKTLADVKGSTCRSYTNIRTDLHTEPDVGQSLREKSRQSVKPSTVRRELKTLQAAINHWHRESPLEAVPKVSLPEEGPRRERFLERNEAAALIRAARRLGYKHVVRFILIGLYTGTRHKAILGLRWMPSLQGGHVDLERGIIYRRGAAEPETTKGRPPVRPPRYLSKLMSGWRLRDERKGQISVICWNGVPLRRIHKSWAAAVRAAGLGREVTPHVLRHTAACWLLWEGKTIWDAAGVLGCQPSEIEKTYGHHRKIEERKRA